MMSNIIIMYKTTLYLPERDIYKLKTLTVSEPRKGLTYHIQQAVKQYLKNFQSQKGKKFRQFKKMMGSSKNPHFKNALDYQHKLRNEWDDK